MPYSITAFEHPIIDTLVTILSFISNKKIYFVIIPLIFWCVHKQIGFTLLYLQVGSLYLNEVLKDLVMLERPPNSSESGYSFPSGHTQAAATFWGFLAVNVKKRIFTILSLLLVLLIGLSRIYIGAHWYIDIIGAIIISLFLIFMTVRTLDWFGAMPDLIKLLVAIFLPLALLAFSIESTWTCGLLLGAGVGYLLEQIKNRMEISSSFSKKAFAFIVGMLGVFAITSMEDLLPQSSIVEFILAIGLGLWITFIAPLLFVSLSIYKRKGGISFR